MGINQEARGIGSLDAALKAVVQAYGGDDMLFREVIEALPAAVYTTDAEGRVTHFNRAAVEMSGREPVLGSDYWCITWKLYWPDGTPCAHDSCPMAIALKERRPVRGREVIVERPDGSQVPVLPYPTLVFGADGELVGAVNLLVDLTELREAETRADTSEERFRKVANITPAMIWTADPSGKLTWASERWFEYSGVARELQSDGWPDLIHPEDLERVQTTWKRAAEAGTEYEVETRTRRWDGEYRWFMTRATPVKDRDGVVTEWIGVATEIHDQKKAEEELRWKNRELDLIAKATPVRLTRCSRELRYLYANQATAELLGVPVEEIIGRPIAEVLGQETFEAIKPFIDRVLAGETLDFESRVQYPSVGERWARVSYVPETNDQGEVTGWISSIIDITERKETEDALEEKYRQQSAIYRLSATVAHTRDAKEIIKAALDAIIVSVRADRASVLLYDTDGVMRFKGWRRLTKQYRDAVEGHTPWKPEDIDAKPITVSDVELDEGLAPFQDTIVGEGIRALAFMPLIADERVIGKFMVYFDQPHAFTEAEIQVCETIARHVSYGIGRTRADEALRESEERFRLATSSGFVGVWDWDVLADSVKWSETTYQIHGVKPGEFGGTVEAFARLVYPDDRQRVERAIRRSLEEDVPYEIEFRVVQPSGRIVWLYTHAKVLRNEEGTPVRMLGGTLDITERKIAEEGLRASDAKSRGLSERLQVLLETTSHLIETLETENLLETILDLSRNIVDADAFGLWRRDKDDQWSVVASNGLSEDYLATTLSGKGHHDLPLEPIIVQPSQMADRSNPMLRERWEPYDREGIRSMLALPLRIHGEVGGTLVFYCRTPHEFSEIEVESARAMANIAAAAITTTELYETQAELRKAAEDDAVRETFLADTSSILSESLDYEETLSNVARAAVPKFADWCAVDLVDEDGQLRRITVAHIDPAKVQLAHDLHEKYPPKYEGQRGVLNVIATGEPEMMSFIPDELIEQAAQDEEHLRLLRDLKLRSYICAPLQVRGEVCGAISFIGAESGRQFDEKDMRVAVEIARRSGTAIENAQLYRDLRASEERFRAIFQRSSVGKCLVSLDTFTMQRVNDSFCEIVRMGHMDLTGRSLGDLVHEKDRAKLMAYAESLAAGTTDGFRDEIRLQQRDGKIVWAIVSGSALYDRHGRPAESIVAIHDITARKHAEDALVEHANTLATLNRTGVMLAAETDLGQLIEIVTDSGTELTGAMYGAFFDIVKGPGGNEFAIRALSGGSREAFRDLALPKSAAVFASVFKTDGIVRCDDIAAEPRLAALGDYFRGTQGHLVIRSYLSVPVVSRSGDVVGGMFFGHPEAGIFAERSERIMSGVASQAAIAIDNAKLYEALSASEKQVRLITDSLPVLVSYVDRSERYRFNSRTYETWFGLKREDITGKTMAEVLGDEARKKLDPYLKVVFGGERVDFEGVMPYREGARHVSISYVPDIDGQGHVNGFFAMVEDISARIKAERKARRSDERLRQAYEAADMGSWRVNLSSRVSTRDANFNRLLGNRPVETSQPMDELFAMVHDEDRPLVEEAWRRVVTNSEPYDVEFRVELKDGTTKWLREVGRFVAGGDGEADSVAGVVLDVTHKRDLDLERLRASKLESIGVLAGGIAHDFNNILTAILGNVSLASMYIEPGSEASERIAAAEKACQRAQKLTHQLLTFSKGGQPVKGLVSISEVIEESTSFVLQGSNVRAVYDFATDLPHVEADAGQIGQVMQNLALNAVQAMPDGGELRIRARRVTLLQDKPPLSAGTYVEVSVADDGCGIPAENLLRIFDPFFTTKSKGSGLGLATTYSIIQRHHGHLEVDSEVGVGSTFRFYLPGSDLSLQPTQEDEWLGTHGSGRILLMDDEPALCDLARAGLLEYGFEVSTATGGSEAVRLFYEAQRAGKPYDAVVLDLTIRGDMGGRETLQRLFTLDPGVKAIVASGYSNDPVMSRHRDYGFSGMIAKPFRMVDLARTIAEVLKAEKG